ncbi:uncharacterized protein LOC122535261 [Frieseomelitta varia]|uniref:uncharacterized protein LOC122535261 n=1 Tax=Frieseomelitta varia TaxID=561572 RepID=UPI001CB67D6C|nr:uncharacterized protein LOC122535261 [Frieseomelitta varia]
MASVKCTVLLLCSILYLSSVCVLGEVYPYPGDCTRYQHCDGSGCFVLQCGTGTEFNPNIGTCDYPLQNRQDCMNRQVG